MPQRRRRRLLNALKTTGRNLVGGTKKVLGPALHSTIKSLAPIVKQMAAEAIKGGSKAALAGIPFTTSGMHASASPVSHSGSGITVSAPSANGRISYTSDPHIKSGRGGNITVSHREFVADVNVETTGFDLQYQFGVNPGNSSLFPWLSQIATRYEMFKFRSLRVIYEPQCGTSTTGTMMLAIDYDASDPAPVSKPQMMAYKNAVRSPLWFACTHTSAAADLHRLKTNYVLSGAQPINTDIKTYDIGNLFVALQSNGGDTSAGELYVEYVVDLLTPQITNDPPSATILQTNDDNNDYSHNIYGPLAVVVEESENQTDLYIASAGYYVLTWQATASTDPDITFLGYTVQRIQGIQQYSYQVSSTSGDAPVFTGLLMFQVVDPESTAVTMTPEGFNFTVTFTVTPISSSAILNTDGILNPSVQNFRARLGRFKPFPTPPPPLLKKAVSKSRKATESPNSPLSRVSVQLQDSTPEET